MSAELFVQWKGTDICADFECECGGIAHVCGDFVYRIVCGDCGSCYEIPDKFGLKKVKDDDNSGCTRRLSKSDMD